MNNNSLFKVRGGWMLPSFYTMLLLLCVTVCSAQNVPIRGTITDAQGVLPSVNIQIKNSTITTVTDANGNFEIQASPEDTLIVSFMGYLSIEQRVGSKSRFDLILVEDATALEEVTVNAGYYKVKDRERTGSITSIKASDIELQPVSSPLAAMQGRMAGVNITQASGTPGGNFSIQIRGLNSLRGQGNDPLYIIDDVPYGSQSLGASSLSNGVLSGLPSPLNSINPSDIESIEVLKDADATAIYGSRGANGVVLITTKKGRAGKTQFNVHTATTIGTAVSNLQMLNTQQYLTMRREAFANDGVTDYPEDAYDLNGTWSQTRDTDWKKELFGKTSYVQTLQSSVSGGSDNTQFMVSGSYRTESTVTPESGEFKKASIISSITHKSLNRRFNLNFSTSYSSDKNILPGIDLSRFAYSLAPNAPSLYSNDGNLNWEGGTFENPLGEIQGRYLSQTTNLLTNALLSYTITEGLTAKVSTGFNEISLTQNKTFPSTMYNPLYEVTSESSLVLNNDSSRRSWIFEPQLNWNGKLGESKFELLAGATFQSQMNTLLSVSGLGFASNALMQSLTAASTLMILNDQVSTYRYSAGFGRLNTNYKEKYFLNITGRRDGSSRFGSNNRFANFGALGLAWIFSKENFLSQNDRVLSFGKIRGSYGIAGNDQIGDYQYLNTYTVMPNIYDGVTGLQPTRLFNPDFGWETNRKLELALELGFLRDRIFISTAFYQNHSSNQLVGIPLPGTTGFASLQSNLDATVQNTGLEVELRTSNIEHKELKWTSSVNFSMVRNQLLSYPDLDGSVYANTFVIGEPITVQRLYRYTGINSETGTYTFDDVNGDGRLTSLDRTINVDFSPEYYGGVGNTITYKKWNFDVLLQFVKQKAFNEQVAFPLAGVFFNQPVSVLNHFPESSNVGAVQEYTAGANADAWNAQDYYTQSDAIVTDASYIRLKSLSITYTLPTIWREALSGKIYLQGQNLLTLTRYNGVDPETQSIYYLPPLRQITLGLQLGF